VEAEIRLVRGAFVAGVVVGPDGRPVASATVRAAPADANTHSSYPDFLSADRSTRTDREGRFKLMGLPPGETYVIAAADYGAVRTKARVSCMAPASGLRLQIDRWPEATARLRLLKPSGEPFEGPVGVWAWDREGHGTGGHAEPKDGVIERAGVVDGGTLVLSPRGYVWIRRVIAISEGGTVDLGDVVLDEGVSLSGRLVDERGMPVEGADIRCETSTERQSRSDADGRFVMDHVPNGGFSLSLHAEGYTWEMVAVRASATTGLRLVLPRAAHVLGCVKTWDGSNPGSVLISLRPSGARRLNNGGKTSDAEGKTLERYEGGLRIRTDDHGCFEDELRSGTWIASVEDAGGREHTLGRWIFKAMKTYTITMVLPAK